MAVAVLDKRGKPLDPCSEKRARKLLDQKRARIHKIYPIFTIRLVDRKVEDSVVHPIRIGIDPGSKTSGLSVSMSLETGEKAKCLMEIRHRGDQIHHAMFRRKMFRKTRRSRKTRYREARFNNRKRPAGWLTPAVFHRVQSVFNLVGKLSRIFCIGLINVETAKFDTQKMRNPEISGIEYQRGTLWEWNVREYLLDKFSRKCVYCGKKNVPFEIDHVHPRSKGGTDRVDNLVLACHECNQVKDDLPLDVFCPKKAKRIKKQLKATLKDAAAMNSTRKRIMEELGKFGVPITSSFGSQTKFNRNAFGVPKAHCLDALFSGETREIRGWDGILVVSIKCNGRGKRSKTLLNKYGFPKGYMPRKRSFFGFQTGDICRAKIKKGKNVGTYVGKISPRSTGYFSMLTKNGKIDSVWYENVKLIQRKDGYIYHLSAIPPRSEKRSFFVEKR